MDNANTALPGDSIEPEKSVMDSHLFTPAGAATLSVSSEGKEEAGWMRGE